MVNGNMLHYPVSLKSQPQWEGCVLKLNASPKSYQPPAKYINRAEPTYPSRGFRGTPCTGSVLLRIIALLFVHSVPFHNYFSPHRWCLFLLSQHPDLRLQFVCRKVQFFTMKMSEFGGYVLFSPSIFVPLFYQTFSLSTVSASKTRLI